MRRVFLRRDCPGIPRGEIEELRLSKPKIALLVPSSRIANTRDRGGRSLDPLAVIGATKADAPKRIFVQTGGKAHCRAIIR